MIIKNTAITVCYLSTDSITQYDYNKFHHQFVSGNIGILPIDNLSDGAGVF